MQVGDVFILTEQYFSSWPNNMFGGYKDRMQRFIIKGFSDPSIFLGGDTIYYQPLDNPKENFRCMRKSDVIIVETKQERQRRNLLEELCK